MNNLAKTALALLVVGVAGYGIGRYVQPAKVQIKKEQVIKEVEVERRNVVVVERETRNADGSVVIDRRTEDRSTRVSDHKSETKESTTITNTKPQYRIRGGAGYDFADRNMQYLVGGEKRFWGPLSLGLDVTVGANSGVKAGTVTASWEF